MEETICLQCKYKRICGTVIKQPAQNTIVVGCSGFEQKKITTNADRIRSMTDEELAAFIEYLTDGCDYMYPKCYASEFCTSGVCHKAWFDWLKQEEN